MLSIKKHFTTGTVGYQSGGSVTLVPPGPSSLWKQWRVWRNQSTVCLQQFHHQNQLYISFRYTDIHTVLKTTSVELSCLNLVTSNNLVVLDSIGLEELLEFSEAVKTLKQLLNFIIILTHFSSKTLCNYSLQFIKLSRKRPDKIFHFVSTCL